MEFISRILKYLFWLLVVSWSVALLRSALRWMMNGRTPSAETDAARAGTGERPHGVSTRRLVRDPVCGMHVAEDLAVPLRDGGALVHFCSTACRDSYASSIQRKAANG